MGQNLVKGIIGLLFFFFDKAVPDELLAARYAIDKWAYLICGSILLFSAWMAHYQSKLAAFCICAGSERLGQKITGINYKIAVGLGFTSLKVPFLKGDPLMLKCGESTALPCLEPPFLLLLRTGQENFDIIFFGKTRVGGITPFYHSQGTG